ncbi:hypothetical protein BAUCODRAFT_32156 [Baudoinia panamericana UAMH 10762]|uniref:Uncharacterized protein n=1 Tax=Baudoinia panamericana (strain UAMH 10762) TaxID=717646 RepID=M2LUB9_BAUPA|nr:uncharacterized protein BAUCODRAFT_32156 [Baudoinia panamericana UAMH 10762]EMC98157.1 hypothetical protein BAUCODRAFT_32156 [Baudoinia panamericana UAMH 10762]
MARPNPPPGQQQQQPVSFKTIPGRHRTQKWQQAKTYNYDGDDWGGFDPYDEYAGYEDEQPAPPMPSHVHRQNSFDTGDEKRQFSGASTLPPVVEQEDQRQRGRNFTNPDFAPPPLNTRASPAPPVHREVQTAGTANSPRAPAHNTVIAPPVASGSRNMDKPLPFIRPSEIYKRMAEEKERERQSMDSSRPSMDSIQRDALAPGSTSPPVGGGLGVPRNTDTPASSIDRRPSLGPVMEHAETYEEDTQHEQSPLGLAQPQRPGAARTESVPQDLGHEPEYQPLSTLPVTNSFGEPTEKQTSPVLPPVSRVSGFGSDFLHGVTSKLAESDEPEREPQATPVSPQQSRFQSTIERVMNAPVLNTGATPHPPALNTGSSSTTARSPASNLQHTPSTGFRSVVNTAFDFDTKMSQDTPPSRDNSESDDHGASGTISRSDTTATDTTAGISPIMSRVPFAAAEEASPLTQMTAPRPRPLSGFEQPSPSPGLSTPHRIPRKPSPSHSRNVSVETAHASPSVVQPGYRRSLDPPSHDNSPARTPGLEDSSSRRVSQAMAAEVETPMVEDGARTAEAPDVADQAAEVPMPHLEPVNDEPAAPAPHHASGKAFPHIDLPTTGRARSGTDYSVREADLAHSVNASPDKASFSPPVAEASAATQQLFLQTHSSAASPVTPRPVSPGIARVGTDGSQRPESPGKVGRVREIAENYNNLDDASRRNSVVSSKSSWSQFRANGSEENLALKKRGTGGSGSLLAAEPEPERELERERREEGADEDLFPQYEQSRERSLSVSRPAPLESQPSFRPHLPGEWVSYAPTPAGEQPPAMADEGEVGGDVGEKREGSALLTPRGEQPPAAPAPATAQEEEPVDFTPTRRPTQHRQFDSPSQQHAAHPDPAATADEEEEPIDFTPTSRTIQHRSTDSSSEEQQQHPAVSALNQVKDAGAALGASLTAMTGLNSHARDFGSSGPDSEVKQPELATAAKAAYGAVERFLKPERPELRRDESAATDVSVVSVESAPPTPPAKDAPLFGPEAPLYGPQPPPPGVDGNANQSRPVSNYFGGERGSTDVNGSRPASNYFGATVSPLKTNKVAERDYAMPAEEETQSRPAFLPHLSTDTGAGDTESDRLRKEIVRSLDSEKRADIKRQSILEDAERTQDALDAPDNERKVAAGLRPEPAAEVKDAEKSKSLPMMLDQRFSFEKRGQGQHVLSPGLGGPPPVIAEPETEPQSPEVKPEAPYERPKSKQLHVMNADEEDDEEQDDEEEVVATHRRQQSQRSLVSPISAISRDDEDLSQLSETWGEHGFQHRAPSPMVDEYDRDAERARQASVDTESTRLPSYYQSDTAAGIHVPSVDAPPPQIPEKDNTIVSSSPLTPSGSTAAAKRSSAPGQRVPPFREILAIKATSERIQAYNETRQTFAEMDTGLNDWLKGMMERHPELANSSLTPVKSNALTTSGTFRHRHSPSLLKFGKQFGSVSGPSSSPALGDPADGERKGSLDDVTALPMTPSRDASGGPKMVDREKMQQKGKEFIKSAGMFGGKAQAGAKGFFQRGKTRFGGRRESGGGAGGDAKV